MKTFSSTWLDLRQDGFPSVSMPSGPLLMCLGNFDGVHLGHASLLRRGMALRNEKLPHSPCCVFTFHHPSSDYLLKPGSDWNQENITLDADTLVLQKAERCQHLTTLPEKLRLFRSIGIDYVCLCDFKDICTLTPAAFLSFLSDKLFVRGVVCGFNYHFGLGGQGCTETMKSYFDHPEQGYFCSVEPPFCLDGAPVSSTRIRQFLLDGDVALAMRHLGHPYVLESNVVPGKQLGRKLGFPTANQNFPADSVIPAHGVYAVICHTPAGILPGVANVGSHPTVDAYADVNCETHIIGFSQSLYGFPLRIEFLQRLRGEEKFDSVEALAEAINRDTEIAETIGRRYLDGSFSLPQV